MISDEAPVERHARNRGRWSEPELPHKGWTWADIEDLGPEENGGWITCEMCQCCTIRYAHHMQHPDHGEVLRVGCVCAGNMAEDYIDAKRRETEFIRLQRPDWFRFVPNVVEIRNCTAVAPDDERYPVALANSLARDNPEKFRGLLVCSACDRLQWADRLREWSTIPNVKISAISTSFHGVPEDRAGVHWTVISYNLARKPYLARMISLNRYGLWVFDRVPSFDVRTLGRSPYTITVDRAAGVRIYEMKQPQ